VLDVDDAHSMEFYGDITSPVPNERFVYSTPLVVKISPLDGIKTARIKFYDENNNASEGMATIIYDTIKPFISSISATGSNEIRVVFSEIVNKADAENMRNFVISGLDIKGLELQEDYQTLIIQTNKMFYIRYVLDARNVRDRASNIMEPTLVSFMGYQHPGYDWYDPEIVGDETYIKAVHLKQLRDQTKAKFMVANDYVWIDNVLIPNETDIIWEHWNELREKMNRAYLDKYGYHVPWVSGPLLKNQTYLSARHLKELRAVIDAF
jgi:hypothetical protein